MRRNDDRGNPGRWPIPSFFPSRRFRDRLKCWWCRTRGAGEGRLTKVSPDHRTKKQRERRELLVASAITIAGILLILFVGIRLATDAGASSKGAGSIQSPAIAVLPFEARSTDRQNASFGIGLADSIIDHLSDLPSLTVRPMSAALKASAGATSPVEAGRLLGVNAIVTGSFESIDNRFVVSVRLIDVPGGAVISERDFESKVDDLAGLESTVISSTLGVLAPRLRFEGPAPQPVPREPNSTAHYLYLLALGKLSMYQGAPIPDAVELLEQSIKADPDYEPAYASLSLACSTMYYSGMTSDFTWIERAISSARRAIALDEKDPSAHHALGHALLGAGEPVEAAREALLALKLDPNHPRALKLLATLFTGAGLPEHVKLLRARIASLDPAMDLEWLDIYVGFKDGHPQETIARFEAEVTRRLAAGESIESQVMRLGYMSFRTGDSAAALRWAATMESVTADKDYADMIRMLALARTGETAAVRGILERIQSAYQRDWEGCAWIGMALALVHENEGAIEWVDRSARLGSYDLEFLDNAVEFDPIRSDPRFEAAMSLVRGRAREIVQLAAFAGYR